MKIRDNGFVMNIVRFSNINATVVELSTRVGDVEVVNFIDQIDDELKYDPIQWVVRKKGGVLVKVVLPEMRIVTEKIVTPVSYLT